MNDHGRFGTLRSIVALNLALHTEGPILVRGPDAFVPGAPDMAFIRMPTPYGDAPFLPGSSLKGLLRSGAEALLRGLGKEACDPTARDQGQRGGCGQCRACRTFGSSNLGAAVVLVGDGMPWPHDASEEARMKALTAVDRRRSVRSGVAIDRQRGSVAVGPFDMEVLAGVTFYPPLTLRNPEPWQLHLLVAALRLLDTGILRLGSGTTKGLGRVRVEVRSASVRCVRSDAAADLVHGLDVTRRSEGILIILECQNPAAAYSAWAGRLADSLGRQP